MVRYSAGRVIRPGMRTLSAYTKIAILFNIRKKNYKKNNINTVFNLCENVFNDV